MSKTPTIKEQEQYALTEKLCKTCGKPFKKSWSKWVLSSFCCKACSKRFSTLNKRQYINNKVSQKLKGTIHGDSEAYLSKKAQYESAPKFCPICKKAIQYKRRYLTTCSRECGNKLSSIKHRACGFYDRAGGVRKGAGRGKSGRYKGIWCDSTWELAYVVYNLDHNIGFKRNTKFFNYIYKGKPRRYYPDFILDDGTYIEIKGYYTEQVYEKIKQFPKDLTLQILDKSAIMPYLNYIKTTYNVKPEALYD